MADSSITPSSGQRTGRPLLGTAAVLALTVATALALVLLPLLYKHAPVTPLLLFTLPLGICAFRYGTRGGLAAAALGALIAIVWYLRDDQQHFANPAFALLARVAVFALIGCLLGAVIDGRRKLERVYHEVMEKAVRERTAELEDAHLETLHMLALASEYRDDDTFPHTERVGQISFLLAQALGLSDEEAGLIRLAAPLHDVGKLGVPDRILLKRGGLTATEFERVKQHTSDGASILGKSNSDVLQLAEQIALSHHEWWDGTGYPHGLQGTEIPLAARIVALADVFDALTHDRPYKQAWSVGTATAEIRRLRSSQFDPDVIDAFEQLDRSELADITLQHAGGPPLAPLGRAA